jgi:hypothetical protein
MDAFLRPGAGLSMTAPGESKDEGGSDFDGASGSQNCSAMTPAQSRTGDQRTARFRNPRRPPRRAGAGASTSAVTVLG